MHKVMIVDDEDIIVTGLSKLLPWSKYNCEVVGTANNGEAALKQIRHYKPDILFTDIRMPGMDGLSLIAALRSEFPTMQITILSGYPHFDYAQRAIRLGVTNYILKPSKMAELEGALKQMSARLQSPPASPNQGINLNVTSQAEGQGTSEPAGTAPKGEEQREAKQARANHTGAISAPAPAATTPLPAGEDNAGNFIISNAVKYIEENYAKKLTLPDVAKQVYVSQWHLSKLISRTTGQSFSDLLNKVRIKKAKILLEDPSLKIWEISEQVGFSDVTHFSRIFKKMENRSANEYRNQLTPSPPKP